MCSATISRGAETAKCYTTSSLWNHLEWKHVATFKEAQAQAQQDVQKAEKFATVGATSAAQPTVATCFERKQLRSIDHPMAKSINRAIGEMICLDLQPFSIVEDVGFQRLMHVIEPRYKIPSRRFFTENMISDLHQKVRQAIQQQINEATLISFTTDSWTAEHTTQSYMSLTAHWIDVNFQRKSAILHCEALDSRRTADHLADLLMSMLTAWNITSDRCHVILRDNAVNIAKACLITGLLSCGCFAHTLQLTINDSLFAQQAVNDAITIARKIVTHFKHSSSGTSKLHELQNELGLPAHQLIQDIQTRWNSTYYMLQRLAEQKRAINIYSTETEAVSTLSNGLLSKLSSLCLPEKFAAILHL